MKKTFTAHRNWGRRRLSCPAGRCYCVIWIPLTYLLKSCPQFTLCLIVFVLLTVLLCFSHSAQGRGYFTETQSWDCHVISECLRYGWCTTEKYQLEPVLLCKGDILKPPISIVPVPGNVCHHDGSLWRKQNKSILIMLFSSLSPAKTEISPRNNVYLQIVWFIRGNI